MNGCNVKIGIARFRLSAAAGAAMQRGALPLQQPHVAILSGGTRGRSAP
jgi:hypothetical protein